jgi:hypothetical protein
VKSRPADESGRDLSPHDSMFHAFGIFAYYDYAISTGPLEDTNNKIKTMKHQAYGIKSFSNSKSLPFTKPGTLY